MVKPSGRVLRIGLLTAHASRANGGVFEAVKEHARLLRLLGHEVHVFAVEDTEAEHDRGCFGDTPVHLARHVGPAQIGFAPGLDRLLRDAGLDMLHLHGIWTAASYHGARWARRSGRPYVISPHGMLDPWILRRSRAKKAVASILFERAGWSRATAFVTLTEDEAADAKRTARARAVVVIPNAVAPLASDKKSGAHRAIAFLSRVHEKKNLPALVAGWRASAAPAAGWRLRIAGWGAEADVTALKTAIRDDPTIEWLGPVFGEAKARLLSDATFLALPSFSEGLPMAILEAWAAGTPTLMSACCHLPEGYAAGAAFDCGTTPDSVAAAINRAVALDADAWRAMGAAAAALARERFSPLVVAHQWDDLYSDLLKARV